MRLLVVLQHPFMLNLFDEMAASLCSLLSSTLFDLMASNLGPLQISTPVEVRLSANAPIRKGEVVCDHRPSENYITVRWLGDAPAGGGADASERIHADKIFTQLVSKKTLEEYSTIFSILLGGISDDDNTMLVEAVFNILDGDSNGKLTRDELIAFGQRVVRFCFDTATGAAKVVESSVKRVFAKGVSFPFDVLGGLLLDEERFTAIAALRLFKVPVVFVSQLFIEHFPLPEAMLFEAAGVSEEDTAQASAHIRAIRTSVSGAVGKLDFHLEDSAIVKQLFGLFAANQPGQITMADLLDYGHLIMTLLFASASTKFDNVGEAVLLAAAMQMIMDPAKSVTHFMKAFNSTEGITAKAMKVSVEDSTAFGREALNLLASTTKHVHQFLTSSLLLNDSVHALITLQNAVFGLMYGSIGLEETDGKLDSAMFLAALAQSDGFRRIDPAEFRTTFKADDGVSRLTEIMNSMPGMVPAARLASASITREEYLEQNTEKFRHLFKNLHTLVKDPLQVSYVSLVHWRVAAAKREFAGLLGKAPNSFNLQRRVEAHELSQKEHPRAELRFCHHQVCRGHHGLGRVLGFPARLSRALHERQPRTVQN